MNTQHETKSQVDIIEEKLFKDNYVDNFWAITQAYILRLATRINDLENIKGVIYLEKPKENMSYDLYTSNVYRGKPIVKGLFGAKIKGIPENQRKNYYYVFKKNLKYDKDTDMYEIVGNETLFG